jgi:hypothetical protein
MSSPFYVIAIETSIYRCSYACEPLVVLGSCPPPPPTPKASRARNVHIPYLYLALSSPSVSGTRRCPFARMFKVTRYRDGANLEF